jgi:catechol 2,3-dioxygenase
MAVMRLGYVHIKVTDLEEARNHYSNTLGMRVVAEEPGKLHLKCWDEYDHHSLVIEEGGVGLVKLGYKCETQEDLALFEHRAQQFGATTARVSKGENLTVGDAVRITIPSEQNIELYTDIDYVGTDTGVLNPDPWPRDRRGAGVPFIDHALVPAEDPATVERFFMECLDFRPSERAITDPAHPEVLGSWLYCGDSPHDFAVVKGPNGKFHHFAYFLNDWNEILHAGDVFAMDDVSIDYGPTRHGITRGTTIYFFDPAGNRNEVFCGGYRTGPDFPTITWTADQLAKGVFYIQREINDRFLTVFT